MRSEFLDARFSMHLSGRSIRENENHITLAPTPMIRGVSPRTAAGRENE
jgi:hypothetical protein